MNTPELPELPTCDARDRYSGEGAFTADQMDAHYLKGYEDARAAVEASQPTGDNAEHVRVLTTMRLDYPTRTYSRERAALTAAIAALSSADKPGTLVNMSITEDSMLYTIHQQANSLSVLLNRARDAERKLAALSQPSVAAGGESEPVAYHRRMTNDSGYQSSWELLDVCVEREPRIGRWNCEYRPLYAHPPQPSVAVTEAMVEAAAKALWEKSNEKMYCPSWLAAHPATVETYTELARAAVAAALAQRGKP